VASLAVMITVSSLIVRWDERRLQRAADRGDRRAEERLERAWSPPSRDNAIIGLAFLAAPLIGLFAVFFHFFRTRSRSVLLPWRWSPTGFFLGLAAALVVMMANAAVVLTLAWALGVPFDE
jgi:hypothetical protein